MPLATPPSDLPSGVQAGPQLVWFKRDLRVFDHRPLAQAGAAGPVLCLYIYEPELLSAADFDAAHLQFVNQSLADLRRQLQRLGGNLTVRTGEAVQVLRDLCEAHSIRQIWAHEETTNAIAYARDRRVRTWAKTSGIRLIEQPQTGVVRRLQDRDGWAKLWNQRMYQPPTPTPARLNAVPEPSHGSLLSAAELGVAGFERSELQVGGEAIARQTLYSFLQERGENYRRGMSSPLTAFDQCSRLSPYLAYGNLSIRTVLQAATERSDQCRSAQATGSEREQSENWSAWRQSLSSFQGRLRWHCHFMQKLEDQPDIEFQNMNRAFDGLREEQFNQAHFEAWCAGQTGYPMIDACMRALQQTGWINFRMRAMLVSFASYHLWLHWRPTALYLARLFLDYEPGIHYSQVQMQSGVTGINTVRIYSPIKQVKDQDPEGKFIRRFLPELEGVPDHLLAEPHHMTILEQSFYGCQIGRDYPAPIVDHSTSYQAARERIHAAKRSSPAREAARAVHQKHGSRRRPTRSTLPDASTRKRNENKP